jgi:hypothetical protein
MICLIFVSVWEGDGASLNLNWNASTRYIFIKQDSRWNFACIRHIFENKTSWKPSSKDCPGEFYHIWKLFQFSLEMHILLFAVRNIYLKHMFKIVDKRGDQLFENVHTDSPDKKNGKYWAAQAKPLGRFSKTKKFLKASHHKFLVALGFLWHNF